MGEKPHMVNQEPDIYLPGWEGNFDNPNAIERKVDIRHRMTPEGVPEGFEKGYSVQLNPPRPEPYKGFD